MVESRWTLVHDSEGRPKSILIINTDITEKKKLETQFFRSQRLENIGMLASGIAHDLNNVLSPIMMAVPMLRDCLSRPEDHYLLDTMGRSVRRGAELVGQILSFARGAEGEHKIVQPKHLLSDIETMVRETFPKNIRFQKNVEPELWIIRANATQVHQVLLNLCVNARDAMPAGGTLSLRAKNSQISEELSGQHPEVKPGPAVVISVADTGMGIAPDVLAQIFEPFFTTKEPGKGTGLGLATVRGILKNHGGFIDVRSEVGKGTQFDVWLPAIATRTAQPGEEKPLAMPTGHGELVLVVDDEEAIQQIARATLENYGYRVLSAMNGVEAVSLYKRHSSDIKAVLLDSTMPLMDGAATLRVLRQTAPAIPILGVSGLEAEPGFSVGPGGVQAFLTKPYTAQELLVKLNTVLRG
jgi:nitrogen-specific signal transduction histidine kinase/CheY-like chemotaxis protein